MNDNGRNGNAIADKTAGFPTILRNVGIWVRKLTFLGFLTNFTIGK